MRFPRHLALSAAALGAVFACASPASAQDLFNDFQSDGSINACDYSPGQLQNGLNNLPPDLLQYAPGFADQLRAGLEAQCGGGAVPSPSDPNTVVPTPAGSGPRPTQRIPKPPRPKPAAIERLGRVAAPPVAAAPGGSDLPDGLIPALAAGLLLFGVVVGGLRLAPSGPERITGPLGAAFSDLGGRVSDALATVWDLVRFGR